MKKKIKSHYYFEIEGWSNDHEVLGETPKSFLSPCCDISFCRRDIHRKCAKEKKCLKFWPAGTSNVDAMLVHVKTGKPYCKITWKDRDKLTHYDRFGRTRRMEYNAFKKCREVKITAEEI